MAAYLCYSICLTGFVYPVVAHAAWSNNGFLSAYNPSPLWGTGMIDFAGSGVVHTVGGTTAIIATFVLGPRKGRFYDSRGNPLPKPTPFPGHSVALQMLGTFILWFGWYGFNPGSALTISSPTVNNGKVASLCAVTTTLSAAMACVTALISKLLWEERQTGEAKFDLSAAMNGALSGLVAITSGCAVVQPWAAVVIGMSAGWCYLGGSSLLMKLRLDDAVDAIPVHLVNGLWGVLATGFYADPNLIQNAYGRSNHAGLFYEFGRGRFDATLLAAQFVGLLFILGWVCILLFPFFILLNYLGWFRADSLEELVGLDISYHGGRALNTETGERQYEYVEAFRKRQGLRRRNRLRHHASNRQEATNGNTEAETAIGETERNTEVDSFNEDEISVNEWVA
jgi:Amt family ammonium transporter